MNGTDIKSIETILTCPDRNYLIVKITDENGIVGYGDATLNGRELAVRTVIEEYFVSYLKGYDSEKITDVWEMLFRGMYWRGGPVFMTALAGVDMALWDMKGKRYGMPLYQMFGGKCRDRVRAYFHVHGATRKALEERIRSRQKDGCTCFRYSFDTKDPTGQTDYFCQPHQDIATGKRIEVSDRKISGGSIWDTETYLNDLISVTAYLREKFGGSIDLIHDSHERFTPIQAAEAAKALEPYRLYFLEDPVEPLYEEGLSVIRSHSSTPIAMGELYNTLRDCQRPIEENLIDYLRLDISHFGGITPVQRAACLAGQHAVKLACHCPTDISPFAHAAICHIDYSIPNFGIQEWVDISEKTGKVFKLPVAYKEGYLYLEDKPGLGVEIDEDEAKKYPYSLKFLPVLRDREGAIQNW